MTNEQVILNHLYNLPKQELTELIDNYVVLSESRVYVPFIKIDDQFIRVPPVLVDLFIDLGKMARDIYNEGRSSISKYGLYNLSKKTDISAEQLEDEFNKNISEPYILYVQDVLNPLIKDIDNVVRKKYPDSLHSKYVYKFVSAAVPSVFLSEVHTDTIPLPSTYADVVAMSVVKDLCEVINDFLIKHYKEWPSLGYKINKSYINAAISGYFSNKTQKQSE